MDVFQGVELTDHHDILDAFLCFQKNYKWTSTRRCKMNRNMYALWDHKGNIRRIKRVPEFSPKFKLELWLIARCLFCI